MIWAHAGRVLDTFLRRRADPALVARYFGEIELNEPFSDALDTGRFGGADAASPASLTRDTFVFHALGSLIGDAPVAEYLDDAEIAALAASAQRSEGDAVVPAPSFTLRNFARQNLLGSFLTAGPAGLLAVASQPDAERASLIGRAILGIKADRDDALSWVLLAQHSRTGLSEAELAAAREVLLAIDANGLAMGPRDGLPLPWGDCQGDGIAVTARGSAPSGRHNSRRRSLCRTAERGAGVADGRRCQQRARSRE